MLKLFDKNHNAIGHIVKYKDCRIESDVTTGDKTLSFVYLARHHSMQNEMYVRTKTDEYVIKEVPDSTTGFPQIVAILNLEDLQREMWQTFSATDTTIDEAVRTVLAGTGWTIGHCDVTKRRNAGMMQVSTLGVIQNLCTAFVCEPVFDTINKTVSFYRQRGEDKGMYFMSGLNLKKLQKKSNSYDYYTRIIPIGQNGLTIESVNDGKNYLENYQYSNKVLTYIWKDESYTDAQALIEDAHLRLEDLSKPVVSYQASVRDLAKQKEIYSILSYSLGDVVTLIDQESGIREKQRIKKMTEYPQDPEKNTCEIANTILTFEEMQRKYQDAAAIINYTVTGDGRYTGTINVSDILKFEQGVAGSSAVAGINSSISTMQGDIAQVKLQLGELDVNYLSAEKADLKYATIESLETAEAKLHSLQSDYAAFESTTTNELNAQRALINGLETDALKAADLSAEVAKLGYATIAEMETVTARIKTLETDYLKTNDLSAEVAKLGYATVSQLNAANAEIQTLKANQITTAYLSANYASIDLANVKDGSIKTAMIGTGAVQTAQIADGSITDAKIVGLTANKITAGTLDAGTIEVINLNAANITVGTINGKQIAAGAIDTSKLSSALSATITDTQTTANNALTQIEGLEIGGRNLLKNSHKDINSTAYALVDYTLTESPAAGDVYTFTLKGTLGSDRTSFKLYNSGGNVFLGTVNDNGDGTYSRTFKWIITGNGQTASNTFVRVYHSTSSSTTASTIDWVKLEKGNKATDWTPAPEDVDSSITSVQTLANNALANAATAQSTADGKNTVFYQTSAPSTSGRKTNDIWFDTDDGNKMYYYNGSAWTAKQFGTNAIAEASITNALIADATIQSAKIANLDAAKITSGYISADRINAGSITYAKLDSAAVASINALVEVGGRNLLLNGSFRKNAANWKCINGTSMTFLDGAGYGGDGALQIVSAVSTVTPRQTMNRTFASGTILTCSVKVKEIDTSWGIGTCARFANLLSLNYKYRKQLDDGWYLYVYQATLTEDVTVTTNNAFGFNVAKAGTYIIDDVKLEIGNKATDWTPAPEDVTADIAEQGIGNWCYNNDLTYINGGKIYTGTVTASAIAASAVTTDKLAASAVTAAKIASRTITADKIVTGAITANEIAAATITANKLASNTITASSGVIADAAITNAKIASIDAAKITSGYISADRINAGSITYAKLDSAAVSAINALVEIGGRNLLIGTNRGATYWRYTGNDGSRTVTDYYDSDGSMGVKLTNVTVPSAWVYASYIGDGIAGFLAKIEPNTEYTLSFDMMTNVENYVEVSIRHGDSSGLLTDVKNVSFTGDEKWHKYSVTLTTLSDVSNTSGRVLYFGSFYHAGYYTIKNLKLEKGNKSTDWTPAPEDVSAEISANGIGNWCYNNDLTYINGAKIYTGTVTADKISAATLSAITANLGTVTAGCIQSPTYSYSSGNYSASGIQIGLTGAGYIRAKNFALDTSGNAYMKGTVDATSLNVKEDIKVYSTDSSDYESVVKATSWNDNYKRMLFGFTGSTDSFIQIEKSVANTGGHITLGGIYTDIYLNGYAQANSDLYVLGEISEGGQTLSNKYAQVSDLRNYLALSGGTVTGSLVLSKSTGLSGTANNSPALLVGGAATAAHIEIDYNGIQAKKSGTAVNQLYINYDGGNVSLSGDCFVASKSGVSDTTANLAIIDGSASTVYFNGKVNVGNTGKSATIFTKVMNSLGNVGLTVSSAGNGGLYDYQHEQWLVKVNTSGTVTVTSSDRRMKNDMGYIPSEESLIILREVKNHKYTYKRDCNSIIQYGMIAQELRDVLLSHNIGYRSILQIDDVDGDRNYYDLTTPEALVRYSIDYSKMVPILHDGWQIHDQQLHTVVSRLESYDEQLSQLRSENAQLKARIARLEAMVA